MTAHLACINNVGFLFPTALVAAMATLRYFRLPRTICDDRGLFRAVRTSRQKQTLPPPCKAAAPSFPSEVGNSVGDTVETVVNTLGGDIGGVFAAAPINEKTLLKAVKLVCRH